MRRSLFWLLDRYEETGESVGEVHAFALEQAALADRLGFESIWLAEHHFESLGTVPHPAVLLAAMATVTERIRLGPATAVLPLRNPIQVAEDYAMVDVVSGGRLNMGVGSGSRPGEFAGFGVDFEGRRGRFDEALTALRARWRGEGALNVRPRQRPTPPIHVAAMSEASAYRIGRAGDRLLTLASPGDHDLDAVAERVRAHARGARDGGSAASEPGAVVMMFAHVAGTDAELREATLPAWARLLTSMSGEATREARRSFERMRDSGLALFTTQALLTSRLQRLEAAGLRHVAFVTRFGGMPEAAARRALHRLAPMSVDDAATIERCDPPARQVRLGRSAHSSAG